MKTLTMKIAHSSKVIHNASSLGGTRCEGINYICIINGQHITNLSKPSHAKQQSEIIRACMVWKGKPQRQII